MGSLGRWSTVTVADSIVINENILPSCLICCKKLNPQKKNPRGNSAEHYKTLRNLFIVLCKHMEWNPPHTYRFNFREDYFPFCDQCDDLVVTVFNLNEKVESLLRKLKQLTVTLCSKVLQSKDEDFGSITGGGSRKAKTALMKTSIKSKFYRSLVRKRFSTFVKLCEKEKKLCDRQNQESDLVDAVMVPLRVFGPEMDGVLDQGNTREAATAEDRNSLGVTGVVCELGISSIECVATSVEIEPAPESEKCKPTTLLSGNSGNSSESLAGTTSKKTCKARKPFEQHFLKRAKWVHGARSTAIRNGFRRNTRQSNFLKLGRKRKSYQNARTKRKPIRKSTLELAARKESLGIVPSTTETEQQQGLEEVEKLEVLELEEIEDIEIIDLSSDSGDLSDESVQTEVIFRPVTNTTPSLITSNGSDNSNRTTEHVDERSSSACIASRKHKVKQIGDNRYIFDNQYPYELNANSKWTCCTCKHEFSSKSNLHQHLARKCKGIRSRVETGDRAITVQINENRFYFQGCRFEKLGKTQFKCCICKECTSSRIRMIKHIKDTHCESNNNHIPNSAPRSSLLGRFAGLLDTKTYKDRHTYVHRGDTFFCQECLNVFSDETSLFTHFDTKH